MVKKVIAFVCTLLLACAPALAEHAVLPIENTEYYPAEEDWTYCYVYRIPQLETGMTDVGAMMINETLVTVLDEMRELVLPCLPPARI